MALNVLISESCCWSVWGSYHTPAQWAHSIHHCLSDQPGHGVWHPIMKGDMHGVEAEHGEGRPWTLDGCACSMDQP